MSCSINGVDGTIAQWHNGKLDGVMARWYDGTGGNGTLLDVMMAR
jgi:hypothetical protein